MKQLTILFSAACLMVFMACNEQVKETETVTDGNDTAQTEPVTVAPPMDSAAMMKAWQDYMTPGEAHKMLASSNGKWKTENKMWMTPDAPPTESKGQMENKMILGGRYQQSTFKGDFNGMPMEGIATMAYDNSKKMFVSTWVDNMGTGIMVMEGTWDDASKSMTLTGECKDPMTGKDVKMKEIYKIIDDKTEMMEMYTTQDGKEYKSMEMKMTRM